MVSINSYGSGGSEPAGLCLTQHSSALQVYAPKHKASTVFHPLPAIDEAGQPVPWLDPQNPGTLSHWVYDAESVVRMAGQTNKVTFLNTLQPEEQADFVNTPYTHFYDACKRYANGDAPDAGPFDKTYMISNPPLIPQAKRMLFMQGSLYWHNGRDLTEHPKQRVLLTLPVSAAQSLVNQVFTQTDQNGNSVVGDLFDWSQPKFFAFLDAKMDFTCPAGFRVIASGGKMNQGDFGNGYAAYLLTVDGTQPGLLVHGDQFARDVFEPWNKVIRVLSVKEQLQLLSSAYRPELVWWAYQNSEFEPFLPDFVKRCREAAVEPVMPEATETVQSAPSGPMQTAQPQQSPQPTQPQAPSGGYQPAQPPGPNGGYHPAYPQQPMQPAQPQQQQAPQPAQPQQQQAPQPAQPQQQQASQPAQPQQPAPQQAPPQGQTQPDQQPQQQAPQSQPPQTQAPQPQTQGNGNGGYQPVNQDQMNDAYQRLQQLKQSQFGGHSN